MLILSGENPVGMSGTPIFANDRAKHQEKAVPDDGTSSIFPSHLSCPASGLSL